MMKKTDLCPQPLLSLQTHIKLKGVPVSRIDRKRFSQTGDAPSHHPLRCLLGIFWVSLSVPGCTWVSPCFPCHQNQSSLCTGTRCSPLRLSLTTEIPPHRPACPPSAGPRGGRRKSEEGGKGRRGKRREEKVGKREERREA